MSSSAINAQLFQAKIGSIQNQADSTSVYSAGIWSFKNSTAVTSVTITDSGNVGIGTDSPAAMNSATLAVVGSQGIAYQRSTNNQFGPTLDWFKSRGSFSAPTIVQNNDGLYTLRVVPFQGSSFTTLNMHAVEIDGTFSSGQNPPTRQVWYTNTANGNSTERMRLDASGNLLVGGTATLNVVSANTTGLTLFGGSSAELMIAKAGATIELSRLSTTGAVQYFYYNNASIAGNISINSASTVGYNQGSDERLKENIKDADSAIEHIKAMQVRSFDWKSDKLHNKYGFIAQELVKIADYAVFIPSNPDEMMGVDFGKLVPALVKCAQEQQAMIESMKAEIEALKAK